MITSDRLHIAGRRPKRITIQGVAGVTTTLPPAAISPVRRSTPSSATVFRDVRHLAADASLLGIMAIENTIAGSLLQNHELLRASNMQIVGEYKMRISHTLAALPGQSIDELTEVNSHPMALLQCEQFLLRHPNMKMIETFDTAGSAKEIAEKALPDMLPCVASMPPIFTDLTYLSGALRQTSAISPAFILADPLIAGEERPSERFIDKSSVVFTLPHDKGALSKVLTILSFYDINLTKIQSMPILGREWEYRFYIDLEFDSYSRYRQAVDAVRPLPTTCVFSANIQPAKTRSESLGKSYIIPHNFP